MISTTRYSYANSEFTPPKLTGKEFEALILHRGKSLKNDGVLSLKRNGVKSSRRANGEVVTQQSYPDFTGTIAPTGRRLELEAKVCSAASFALNTKSKGTHIHSHQIEYLLEKAKFGASSYLLIHFNLKVSKRVTHEEFSVAITVHPKHELWRGVDAGVVKSLSRSEARRIGIVLPWGFHGPRVRTLTPDLRVLL